MNTGPFLMIILSLLNSCASGKIANQINIQEIRFGNGGGITGEIKTFVLRVDGKLFEKR